ncbi:hypothetical protein HAX54_042380 [Datura stramonium]|uniref:DUF4283 domain-containing protein n=1 Tax=Datura stramonium TaxID=4076 RepID=A0ABS8W341_DATST|nr:hypothetical protein [Datura stramonium]
MATGAGGQPSRGWYALAITSPTDFPPFINSNPDTLPTIASSSSNYANTMKLVEGNKVMHPTIIEAIPLKPEKLINRVPRIKWTKDKIEAETTKIIAWISFPNMLPTYFVKENLFSLALAVGKPLQLDAATINKIGPSCAKIIVLVDLVAGLSYLVIMDIENDETG